MPRLEKPRRRNASLSRRALLAASGASLAAACGPGPPLTASTTPQLDMAGLNEAMAQLAQWARPGVLGVGLINLESGEHFSLGGDRRFPLAGIAKLLVAAAVLAEADARRLYFNERFVVTGEQLSPPYSPAAADWPVRQDYTAEELFELALVHGDNTAHDVLLKRIGGPGAVTAWLNGRRVRETRVDRYARELAPEVHGLASFRPAWRTEAAFAGELARTPPHRRWAAMQAYIADPRDTASPRGLLEFLQKLDGGELLSAASTRRLLQTMTRTPAQGGIRAGLPSDAVWAHRPGQSRTDMGLTPAANEAGFLTLADGRSYALAVFLAGSTLDEAARGRLFADIARAAVAGVG